MSRIDYRTCKSQGDGSAKESSPRSTQCFHANSYRKRGICFVVVNVSVIPHSLQPKRVSGYQISRPYRAPCRRNPPDVTESLSIRCASRDENASNRDNRALRTRELVTEVEQDIESKHTLPSRHTLWLKDTGTSLDNNLSRVRSLAAIAALIAGFVLLPSLASLLAPLLGAKRSDQVDTVITGGFMPLVGILFAMFSSTAVSTLRQRQQDLRDVLNQELAVIRTLLVMIKDESIIKLLLRYTLELEAETFSAAQNRISYEHETPHTDAAIARERAFAESEETLWLCVQEANDLRLRPEVEASIRSLVTFRTRRRAVLDSGLPRVHFAIIAILGISMLLAFALLSANDGRIFLDVLAVRLLFGILLALQTLTYVLLVDLRDPFGGDYRVEPWRLYRTIELLEACLQKRQDGSGKRS